MGFPRVCAIAVSVVCRASFPWDYRFVMARGRALTCARACAGPYWRGARRADQVGVRWRASKLKRVSMSDYDRTANARYGAGVARSGVGAIDQGLRAYMIGVYHYMTLGLGITGLVALGAFKLGVVENEAGRIIGLT